ncbi:MAG: lysylphosphatidylglycerol synthase transmembrane domain-containing protein [Anaerolineae bacterium]
MSDPDATPPERRSRRPRLGTVLRIAVSLVLLALLFRNVALSDVVDELRDVDVPSVAGAVLLYVVLGTFVRGNRWRALITSLGHPISRVRAMELFLVGTFFNQLLPTGIGGDLVRALALARDGLGRARAFSTVLVDRALGILPLLAVGLVALLAEPGQPAPMIATMLLATGIIGVLGIIVLFQAHRLQSRLSGVPGVGWAITRPSVARFLESFAEYDRRALLTSTAWAFVFALLLIGANALLGRAVGITQATLLDWAVLVPLAALSTLLPSVGGWGVREWTYVGLLGSLHPPVSAETATAVSLLFGGMNLMLAAAGAVLTAAGDTVGLPSMDRLRREAERRATGAPGTSEGQ